MIAKLLLFLTMPALVCAQPGVLWTRIISGEGYLDAQVIGDTDDGGFFLAGRAQTAFTEFPGLYLARLDSEGNALWQRTYATNSPDSHVAAVRTPDGGFIVAGSTSFNDEQWPRLILLRTDADGDSLWASTYSNDTTWAYATSCGLWNDGGFWVAGNAQLSDGRSPGVVVMFGADGDSLHSNFLWGSNSCVRIGAAAYLYDHHFLLVGATQPDNLGPLGTWYARADSLGDWVSEGWGNYPQGETWYVSMANVIVNPIIVGGWSTWQDSSGDFYCVRLYYGVSPYEEWVRFYGTDARDENRCVAILPDTTFLFGGSSDATGLGSQFSLYRLGGEGDVLWQLLWGDTDEEQINSIVATADGGFVLCGTKTGSGHSEQIYVARYESITGSPERSPAPDLNFRLLQNYPNPFNSTTTIPFVLGYSSDVRLELFDITGRLVRTLIVGRLSPGPHAVYLDSDMLSSGSYVYRLLLPNGSLSHTLTLIR